MNIEPPHCVRILERDVIDFSLLHKISKREAVENMLQNLPITTTSLYLGAAINMETIPSLKHLTNLKNLDISFNLLKHLPEMPEGLTWLMCTCNRLTSLEGIPSTVHTILADQNRIRSFSWRFPSLKNVCLIANRIKTVGALPPNLESCFIGYNHIQCFPDLPETLQVLSCGHNDLIELPSRLPASLQTLFCEFNPRLSALPDIPHDLVSLSVRGCNISRLPRLPDTISTLEFHDTPVVQMVNLPLYLFNYYQVMENTPIGEIIRPTAAAFTAERSLSVAELLDICRANLHKLNRFRELYYSLRYKRQFWKWLWNKYRITRIERAYHPDRLRERLEQEGGEEADLEAVLQSLG